MMNNKLYKSLFDFKLENNMRISTTKNEIYNQTLLYIFSYFKKDIIILTSNLNEATNLYNNLKNYVENIYLFPEDDILTKKAIATSPELLYMRLKFLNDLSENQSTKIIVCHLNSFLKKLPPPNIYDKKKIKLVLGQNIDRNELIKNLDDLGYKRDYLVNNIGEIAIRGFVIDIFPIESESPVRIEFFGDTIEKIKYFDENTQLSYQEMKKITIKSIVEENKDNNFSLIQHLNSPYLIFQDLEQILTVEKTLNTQLASYLEEQKQYFKLKEIEIKNKIYIDLINNLGEYDLQISASTIENYNENIKKFISDLKESDSFLVSKNKNLISTVKKEIPDIKVIDQHLNSGFVYKGKKYFSETNLKKIEINTVDTKFYKFGKKVNSLEKLQVGDYVVHRSNGIGIYMGIETITKDKIAKDFILIKYKGNDKLYLPVENVDKLYKYSSKEGVKPAIHRLNSIEWQKTKIKIKNTIKNITEELIKIYKKRNVASTIPFSKDNENQMIFENEFIYEETTDQLKAVQDIKRDLESNKPMDRLLCGDVGYGKTEVIFRAIFKTIMNNKQIMYLCPTTVLSYQQYVSALERFKNFAVNIDYLNRNKTKKEADLIVNNLSLGKIDIIFGTHRLLSSDVKFKELGLLIIDEEHKFGVKDKEKIKKIKENVHVLSVSATPIPRSLQMSLVGIRDLSLIDTPPKKRLPVQTYVIEYNENLLREAVLKEINRDGQVFILFNRVDRIEAIHKKISTLIPEAKIKYAHGNLEKNQMQKILLEFINHEFNVLISTTIIENGIDIPNANTMIIIDSDKFGLSQLYQIRGRVGRSDRIAYAYLMYDKSKILTETASKRLDAIKEFTELGSGYKISMRDLSIRGAGDLLGKEQAGFIVSVGIDLYLELINEEVTGVVDEEIERTTMINDITTHIDKSYSEEEEIIIDLHKKVKEISTEEDIDSLKKELKDRFGKIDHVLEVYMQQSLLEKLLYRLNIILFENNKIKITIKLNENLINKLNMERLFVKATQINAKFKFSYKNKYLLISLLKNNLEKHYTYYLLSLVNFIKKEVN